nr:M15 family metallopeptidase [Natronospira proteinivora]
MRFLLLALWLALTSSVALAGERQTLEGQFEYLSHVASSHQLLGIPARRAADYPLSLQWEAEALVSVGRGLHGREHFLAPEAAVAWRALSNRARSEGLALHLVSSFRSVNYQTRLIQQRLDEGRSLERILIGTALPGYSEHHSGCAIDLATPDKPTVRQSFRETEEYAWLQAHADEYGFRESYPLGNDSGLIPEPWHWFFEACER